MIKMNRKYLLGILIAMCLSVVYEAFRIWQTETYLCKGEIVKTYSSTLVADKEITKTPIEFGFSWDRLNEKLEISNIGDLGHVYTLIDKRYPDNRNVILNSAYSSDKNINFGYVGDGHSKDQHLTVGFDFDRISNYLIVDYSMNTHDNYGMTWDKFKVTAKCSRKWL